MSDQHVPSPAAAAEVFGPLHGGERMMWQGRCGVAEYAFDQAASLPRWTLPESTSGVSVVPPQPAIEKGPCFGETFRH